MATQKGGGGKTNASKIFLRKAPFNFADGDVVGVKSKVDDPENRDDFVTLQVSIYSYKYVFICIWISMYICIDYI